MPGLFKTVATEFIKQPSISYRHTLSHKTFISALFAGAGMYYSIEEKKYYKIPIACIFPSAFVGYHLYKHREDLYTNKITRGLLKEHFYSSV